MSGYDPVRRFLAGALMAVGGLIAGLCGTCTAATLGFGVVDAFGGSTGVGDLLGAAVFLALIGGVPTLLGVLIFRAGLRRLPRRRASREGVAGFGDDEGTP